MRGEGREGRDSAASGWGEEGRGRGGGREKGEEGRRKGKEGRKGGERQGEGEMARGIPLRRPG